MKYRTPFGAVLILLLLVAMTVAVQAQNRRAAINYVARGTAKMDANDLDGALADFTRAIELDRNYGASYFSRGLARRRLSDLDGAINVDLSCSFIFDTTPTADPTEVAKALKNGQPIQTVVGPITFDEKGDIKNAAYDINVWHDGKYGKLSQ